MALLVYLENDQLVKSIFSSLPNIPDALLPPMSRAVSHAEGDSKCKSIPLEDCARLPPLDEDSSFKAQRRCTPLKSASTREISEPR